jgi:hypothetical protein
MTFGVDPDPGIHACLMDPDPYSDPDSDPAIFVIELQDTKKKYLKKKFYCLLLFEGTLDIYIIF